MTRYELNEKETHVDTIHNLRHCVRTAIDTLHLLRQRAPDEERRRKIAEAINKIEEGKKLYREALELPEHYDTRWPGWRN